MSEQNQKDPSTEKDLRIFNATLGGDLEDLAEVLKDYSVDKVMVTPLQILRTANEIKTLRRTIAKMSEKIFFEERL